jgi:HD-like signal output (HDOD) protein
MKRVLFVDDEPRILEGLERMLFSLADEWEMDFVGSGEVAIEVMEDDEFDVIVTDMRMPPGMDGAKLLSWVREHRPDVVRIVLSGYADEKASLRAVRVAHQFLSKPCSAKQLRSVVERACRLREMLAAPELRESIGGLEALPPLPRTFQRLNTLLAQDDVSMRRIGEVASEDAGLAAKLLQIVNSAFFALPREVASVSRAVAFLGATQLRNLVLAAETFASFPVEGVLDIDAEQNHALLVARLCQQIAEPDDQEDAFVAGLLHDIGRLALAVAAPERLKEIEKVRRDDRDRAWQMEVERGIRHDHVGAYLLGIWGLPYPIVEAAAFHHDLQDVPQERFDLLATVHVANGLANGADLDELRVFLANFGYDDRLEEWQALVDECAAKGTTG